MKKSICAAACLFIYSCIAMAIVLLFTKRSSTLVFVWNAFLAFLPLLFANVLSVYLDKGGRNKLVVIALAFLWLLFFPNAPYMVTDMIYFGDTQYVTWQDNAVIYTTDMVSWVKLAYLGLGIFYGTAVGMESLYDIHQRLTAYKGKAVGVLGVLVTCGLSGFAIYIGRILRINSWDILHPFSLLTKIADDFSRFSLLFSLLFAGYVFCVYLFYYVLKRRYDAPLKQ
jgi:uncharacterized membrane protein